MSTYVPAPPHLRDEPDGGAFAEPDRASRIRFVVATLCAIGTSGIALSDAIVHGLTGHSLLPDDETAPAVLIASLVHGVTYAVLCWVLVAEAHRIDAGHRVSRWLRRALIVDLGALSGLFLVGIPLSAQILALRTNSTVDAVLGIVGNSTFLGMFVLAIVLGSVTIRRAAFRPAPYLLIGLVPAIGVIVALGALGSNFAHPAYAETLVNFGIALLALRRHSN